ncbi:MAG: cupin domain-containing protein [Syntrophobacterales bacterium]|nr:MAG: cupin domain-containing protein [Syntrophobacterales bacterium]
MEENRAKGLGAPDQGRPNHNKNPPQMELPFASDQEFKKRVVHYPDIPLTELVPGSNTHLIFGDKIMVSFLTMSANSYFPPHRHEAEQIMIVIDGYADEIVDGKLYRLERGDVILLPSNIEHGAYLREVDCRAIDIFSPPREDFRDKYVKAIQKTKERRS